MLFFCYLHICFLILYYSFKVTQCLAVLTQEQMKCCSENQSFHFVTVITNVNFFTASWDNVFIVLGFESLFGSSQTSEIKFIPFLRPMIKSHTLVFCVLD